MAIYKFAAGSHHKVSAQVAGEVCAELEKDGKLDAQTLVDISRPEDAPLHPEFEWNDNVAAEEWRKHQARNLIATIIVVDDPVNVEPYRAYLSISKKDPNYESTQAILKVEDKRTAMLNMALRELRAFQNKYRILSELKPVFDAIDLVEEH